MSSSGGCDAPPETQPPGTWFYRQMEWHAAPWVITDSHHPVQGDHDRLILLDATEKLRLAAERSADLPTDLQLATSLAKQRMQSGGTSLQKRLADAYQDITDARSRGIVKMP